MTPTTPLYLRFMACLVITLGITSLAQAAESMDPLEPAELVLARQIVSDYRNLRNECNQKSEKAQQMCYYRLKIGIWDYKQAHKTVKEHREISRKHYLVQVTP